MATWAKIKFFHSTMLGSTGSSLTALTTESTGDFDVDYLYNMLETNKWKATNTTDVTIIYDAGVGNTETADYLAIIGHNFFTADAQIDLEYSSTGAWGGEEVSVVTALAPTSDDVILNEFAQTSAFRYWRLTLSSLTVTPFMAICIWGNKTELDYATTAYDPHGQTAKANINITQGGYMAGSHTKYLERNITFNFNDADSTLYDKIFAWWETSGLKNFFVAWETANNPTDVWLMRPDTRFNNPLTNGGAYRNITISLKGRLE